jgi:heme exporter protein A
MLQGADLTLSRGGIPVLSGVNFTLQAGHALILRGPNGIGKTTLLRAIAGLQPFDAGTLTGAEDQIAYGAHADGVKATLSVHENLTFWAACFGSKGVDRAMSAMNLDALSDRRAANLSAGQKRRLGLARLLVSDRPIWILDEPTISLDSASVMLFAQAIRGHLGQGGSALIATHIDLGFAAEVLDLSQFRAKSSTGAGAFDEAFS